MGPNTFKVTTGASPSTPGKGLCAGNDGPSDPLGAVVEGGWGAGGAWEEKVLQTLGRSARPWRESKRASSD